MKRLIARAAGRGRRDGERDNSRATQSSNSAQAAESDDAILAAPEIQLPRKARVLFAHHARDDVEAPDLDLRRDDVVTVTEMRPDGWWHGIDADGMEGNFPGAFVCLLSPEPEPEVPEPIPIDSGSAAVPLPSPQTQPPASSRWGTDTATGDAFGMSSSTENAQGEPRELRSGDNAEAGDEAEKEPTGIRQAKAAFSFRAQNEGEVSIQRGMACAVLSEIGNDWCIVWMRPEPGKAPITGRVPARMLEPGTLPPLPAIAAATHDYTPQAPCDLPLVAGCRVVVLRMHSQTGWCEGEAVLPVPADAQSASSESKRVQRGLFPVTFVRFLSLDEAKKRAVEAREASDSPLADVILPHISTEPRDLSVQQGAMTVAVLDKHESGWWSALSLDKGTQASCEVGLVPMTCLRLQEESSQ